LLKAGAELFAELGFSGVRVEGLARRAGVNKAMINYHFGGKRKLYDAVLEAAFGALAARVRKLRSDARPAPELMRSFIGGFVEVAGDRLLSFPTLFVRGLLDTGRISKAVLRQRREVLSGVHEIIERGISEGSFRQVNPTLTFLNLIAGLALFFAIVPSHRRVFETAGLGELPSPEAYVKHVEELLLRGLAGGSHATKSRGAS
jgi:AcrR family transcriptional regulator